MENGPFIDDVPTKTCIYNGFSIAMLVITRWYNTIKTSIEIDDSPYNMNPINIPPLC